MVEGWVMGFAASFFITSFLLCFLALYEKEKIGFYLCMIVCGLSFTFIIRAFYDMLGG